MQRRSGHHLHLLWVVYLVTEANAPRESSTPHVTIVAALIVPATHDLANELRRDSLQVDVGNADVMRNPPANTVYVFCFDAALGVVLADRIVAWGSETEQRPGLIGVIEDGGGHEREALLAAGFDDVIAGALSARELSARVRAVYRRMHWKSVRAGRLRFGVFTLDLHNHMLWTEGRSISLTSIELAVMRELIKARGRPLSRIQLLDTAWGDEDLETSERAVDNVILRLRRKLPNPDSIETVRSVGFRLV
ncbi:MAG: putative two component transcriptional regulator, winged helix family [Myxococcales bacterium]|nr:putative two component transcriptional regulator, winged helix family [Myxococcales bacterium]